MGRSRWSSGVLAIVGVLWFAAASADPRPGLEAFSSGRFSEALLSWQQAARSGDAASALYLGVVYDTGTGVAQDYAKALAWYELGGEEGNATAMFNAAVLHDVGRGAPANTDVAIAWYRRAGAKGSARAYYDLGLIYSDRKQRRAAVRYFRLAASMGIEAAEAQLRRLGATGSSARHGAAPPEDPAMVAFRRAQDVLLARGVAQASQAAALFRQAAEAGNPLAAYNLAYCYEHGIGVARDRTAAIAWYQRSATATKDAELRSVAEASARSLAP